MHACVVEDVGARRRGVQVKGSEMRLLVAALLLTALPLTARGATTTYTVADDATLSTAMTSAVAGDVVLMGTGTYSANRFHTTNAGTAGNCIRILGDTLAPANVLISGAVLFHKSYVSVGGVRILGAVSFDSTAGDSFYKSIVDSGGFVMAGNAALFDTTALSGGNHLRDCTFNVGDNGNTWVWMMRDTRENTFTRVRVFARKANTGDTARGRYLYYSQRNRFTDCRLDMEYTEVNPATNTETYALTYRDDTNHNVHVRDTVWVGLLLKHSRIALLSHSGNAGHQTEGNQWYACDYRSYNGDFAVQDSLGLYRGTIMNSVFASFSGVPLDLRQCTGSIVRGNTFYAFGRTAVTLSEKNPVGSVFAGNVFVARPYRTCTSFATTGAALGVYAPTAFGSDSNFFAPSVANKSVASHTVDSWICKSLTAWQVSGDDRHSRARTFSGDLFVDGRWDVLDLRPAHCSPLTSAAAPGGHYGAKTGLGCP